MNHINDILNSNQNSKINFSKIIFFNDLKNKIQKSLKMDNDSIISYFLAKKILLLLIARVTQ